MRQELVKLDVRNANQTSSATYRKCLTARDYPFISKTTKTFPVTVNVARDSTKLAVVRDKAQRNER